ncbi:hypothetical protein AGDE_14655 [Angomonas deanei]|uniref:XRN 5'-3' exonuclease N-terminus, putative n=1 Tax=Angomonas deanei TaxID=59799 RepID=A0A7G2CT68_9TRYP|nr:hypothetical protein AGDE_14655 [Angomonas deanei]CAD2221633.1 XRN 5'-3' exonuclease N-terminus, putative [Angomonas deanei]|eukprot:EPY20470.1 hypothetical protein AGDE_14655 [Angomonas deanei]
MGVPKFAAWLTKKYPDMVVDSIDGDVHGLYIDLNGLIHPCCHDEEDPSVALRPDHEKLLDICLSVETLVVTTRPQQVIYIAIDGVAPRAKMNQQRARRYMSAAIPQGKPATEAGQDGNTVVRSIEKEFTTEEKVQAEAALEEVKSALEGDALYQGGAEKDSTPFDALLPNADDLLESNHVAPYMAHAKVEKMKKDPNAFDSNCLSPGTSFMEMVAEAVHNFIQSKLTAEEEESTDGDESV